MSEEQIWIASTADFDERGLQVVEHEGQEILLCNASDGVYAVENLCSHAAEQLFFGKLKGDKIFCPLHGGSFDVRTGEALSKPASLPIATFKVVVQDYDIFLRPDGD